MVATKWSDSFFFPLGHPVFGIADLKSEVVKLVELGVALGIFNGCFNDFDSVDGSAFFSKGQRNRPDSAVGIDRGFFSGQVGEPDCGLIKLFRLNRVDLVERLRGNLEFEAVQRVLDVILAKKQLGLLTKITLVLSRLTFCMTLTTSGQAATIFSAISRSCGRRPFFVTMTTIASRE